LNIIYVNLMIWKLKIEIAFKAGALSDIALSGVQALYPTALDR
jgi:hypothetical protein